MTGRAWYLDPYPAPSHRYVRELYRRHSRYAWEVVELTPQGWRWRLRSAGALLGLRLRERIADGDLVLTTSMLDAAQLLGVLRRRVRLVLYMHENQLTYAREGPGRDESALRHLHGLLAADAVVFNSAYHRDGFAAALARCWRAWPGVEFVPPPPAPEAWRVVHPGIVAPEPPHRKPGPPLILWNHRWCPEKRPEWLLTLLTALPTSLPWRLAVVGPPNERPPAVLAELRARFAERLVAWGWVPRPRYEALLAEAAVVLSTAAEENFGIALLEGAAAGAVPLAPRALVYPEVLPAAFHAELLYDEVAEAAERLAGWLADPERLVELGRAVAAEVQARYAPERFAAALDAVVAAAPAPC